MTLLVLFSLAVFATYLIIMARNYGVQPSISDNFYVSKQPWVFTAVFWIVAFCMAPAMIDTAPEDCQFTGILAGAGIAFVGTAAAYKQSLTNTVHMVGAGTAGLMATVWALYVCLFIASLAIIVACLLFMSRLRTKVYWIELTAFIMTYITYFIGS